MTLVDYNSGEVVEYDRAAAERRAERIANRLDQMADNAIVVQRDIREAIAKRDDIALGYRSVGDYVSDRFGGAMNRLGVDVRRAFVAELTQAGMSTRAIAPVVGVSKDTVQRDAARVSRETPQTPEPSPASGAQEVARAGGLGQTPKGEVADVPDVPAVSQQDAAAPRPPVTGIDGKTYTRPEPRRPLVSVKEDEWNEQDRAEELARNLARNLSLLYAVTDAERRADYIATWRNGTKSVQPLGHEFIDPQHMRDLSDALNTFADEWENAHV